MPRAEGLRHRLPFAGGDGRRYQQCEGRQEQHGHLEPRIAEAEALLVILQSAQEEGRARHEQHVGDDGADQRCLDEEILARLQGGNGDDQFGEVSQRRVEQPAHGIAGSGRNLLGGEAQYHGEWNNGQNRQQEDQRLQLGQQVLAHQDDRHENEKPEKAILAQGRQQLAHPSSVSA